MKQDSPLALWTWGVRVAGFESTGRALRGEMLSVGYRALPVACVLPAWHFLPLTPGCATAVTQDRAASREMRRLGLLHKRERSGRARGLQMKNGNKRRASGKKSILFNSFIYRPAGRAGLCCRSTGTRGRAHVGARKLSISSRVSKWQSILRVESRVWRELGKGLNWWLLIKLQQLSGYLKHSVLTCLLSFITL